MSDFQNPHTIVSTSGKVYYPLSRPSTAPGRNQWLPTPHTARTSQSIDFKRIPTNPRYGNVRAKTDSGASMRKFEDAHGPAHSRLYRRSEPFRRIKASNLADIVRSGRVGRDVLVLDLRTEEEFNACHIKGAVSYPSQMMSRSMYQFTPEILKFKNREGCLMVLYDIEERLSASVGTLWYEKAIENFVVLNGGMAALLQGGDRDCVEGVAASDILSLDQEENTPPAAAGARPAPPTKPVRPASAGMASARSAPLSVPRPARWQPLQPTARMPPSQQMSYVSYRDSWNLGSV
uniref:Rhodanese domain-containing protein n=1 Tax=Hemiselmis andersenii TaxID=464988 RepID=A0A7S1DTH6_HEMAN|eukprot:CAMPEP_0114127214 /NCGR_PEP_ID=MMETSP0043_2-20121206/10249_1 /TAXON_ID=464988 /ORGANISM="Hemiselmis andersenii, Strain CCMP644" /LENGTH=290 /DNA_ID=CAMNT_0001220261 /DNA_START=2712 /DNA_END=3580 /DNA_ORIENTATION=-